MLKQIDTDLPNFNFVTLICNIQRKLNTLLWGFVSLRDVERFRQIYTWLKEKLPEKSVIVNPPTFVRKYYANKHLRAFIISLSLTYFNGLNRADLKNKVEMFNEVKKLVDDNSSISNMKEINFDTMREFKKFEENDFSQRLPINFEGISLNTALKENLYFIFICVMKRIPAIIKGDPGSSKSLAHRIICNAFNAQNTVND
jgi:hypothetical protein